MIGLQKFCDAQITCCDGEIRAPRAMVALVYPFLFSILTELENTDSIMLILPQYQMLEVEKKIMSRISCGLKVKKILYLTISYFMIIIIILCTPNE